MTLGRGRERGESQESGWQLRHTNALSVFGFRHGESLTACCLQTRDENSTDTRMQGAEKYFCSRWDHLFHFIQSQKKILTVHVVLAAETQFAAHIVQI